MSTIDSRRILKWQVAGFLEMITVGAILHFTYAWSGYSPVVALFSAVNESVWEHLKLGFSAAVVFGAVEFGFIGRGHARYFLAKAAGILTLQIFIVAFFYAYTAFTGAEILILDIGSFVVGSALCQLVAYRILVAGGASRYANPAGIGILLVHAALLVVFTFQTPSAGIFRDPHSGELGTQWHVDAEQREAAHDH